jgi:hypothetical protein
MNDDKKDINIEGNITNAGNVNVGGTQNFYGPVNIKGSPEYPVTRVAIETIMDTFNSATARLAHLCGTFADTGISIPRSDVDKIVDWISHAPTNQEEAKHKLALVTGKPGQGKSVVMQQLAVTIQNNGYTVLGIKADDLASIRQPLLSLDDLAQLLQLPAPIEQCIKKAADENLCIVLIDQLDTLALTLNTDEQSLRVITNLIDRLRQIPNVKLVVSCRDFERMNDPILGGIKVDQSFSIGELQEDDINHVLQQLNQSQMQELPRPLQKLLKTPLYLDIYAQILVSGENPDPYELTTLQDLYGKLWKLRIEHTDVNAPSPAQRRQAIFHLVDQMEKQRKLKLHISTLDEYPEVRQYLQRTGFIQEESHNVSFLHQTLFSYCYARKFINEQKSLSSVVFASPQGFFERQLVIEVIQHLRSTDLETYHQEIEAMLFPSEDIHLRYHLRLLLLKWLAWQNEPTQQEYSIVIRIERTNLDDFQRWLRNTGNNHGWLHWLENDISRWLSSSDNRVNAMAVHYLANFRDTDTTFVIEHIKPYLDRSQEWNQRIAWLLQYIKNWEIANDAIELLIHLVRNGDISVKASNYTLVSMANSNAVAGCQLLRLHGEISLRSYKDLKSRQTDQYSRPFPEDSLREAVDSWEARGFISVVARSNPQAILDNLLSWFLETAIVLTDERESSRPYYPSNWFFNDLHEMPSAHHNREGISLTQGILQALSNLAHTNPEAFRKTVSKLTPIEVRIVQQMLLAAFRANPSEYVADIYDFLTGDPRRLYIQPDARLLLGAVCEHSDESLRKKWESFIFSIPKKTADEEEKSLEKWRRYFRYWQSEILDFLMSIDNALLTDNARLKKLELLRLPEFENYEPSTRWGHVFGGAVEAPIPPKRQEKLSDTDWLRILRKYDDETDWGKPRKRRHILEGGVVEMSRALQEQVKQNPERFYRLSKKLDATISSQYISAIIMGFAHHESNADPHWMFELFQRFHSQITGYSRIGVSNALAKMAPSEVPDDIIDVLVSWAKDDPNPDCEDEKQKIGDILKHTTDFSDELINRAINSVRSSVLEDVCRLLFSKVPAPLEQIYEIIRRGIEDNCASVRTIAVQQLAQWQNITKDHHRSIELLEFALNEHIILLTTHPIHSFLNWLSFVNPDKALPYLQIMLEFPHENTVHIASQLICVAGLYQKNGFEALVSNLHESKDAVIRRGATVIYAQEIGNPEKTSICCERLLNLMTDEDEQVRIQTTNCFRRLESEHMWQLQNFFREFIKSPALQHGGDDFIEYLTRSNLVTPEEQRLSLSLVQDLLEAVNTDLGNYDRGYFTMQRELTLYLRNLYDKTVDHQLRENIMDLFDEMLRLGSDEALKMLQAEDLEWLPRL